MSLFIYFTELLHRAISILDFLFYAKARPEDFTRMRKLSFPQYIMLILKGAKHGIQTGVYDFLDSISTDVETYSKQAFSQGRLRIRPEAFKYLFDMISAEYYKKADFQTYKGFRVSAIDGSDYNLPNVSELREKFGEQKTPSNPQVQATTSCLYDVLNHIVMDAKIYPCNRNEREIAKEHLSVLERFKNEHCKELVVFDRGYPSADLIHTLEEAGYCYLMRCSSEFVKGINRAGNDCTVTHNFKNMKKTPLTFRFITLALPNGNKEYLITNVLDKSFTIADFKKLYQKRWEIEEKYNDIKNKLQIENFSGTTEVAIMQDFYATMLLSNLAQSIIYDNHEHIEALHSSEDNQYSYAMNVAMTISELKTELVKCLMCESRVKSQIIYARMIRRLEKSVVQKNRARKTTPRTVAHRSYKHPQNKRYGCP